MRTLLSLLCSVLAASAALSSPVRDDIAGRSVFDYDLGSGIVEVAYLESTGTQFINTGIYGGDGTFAEIRVRRLIDAANECFLGAWENGQNRLWLCYSFSHQWYPGYGNVARAVVSASDTEWHDISLITDSRRYIGYLIDGESYFKTAARYTTGFSCSNPILMFAMGTDTGANYFAIGQISACRIYHNGVLVRDFQPVRIGSTGYMLDTITGTLFVNQGTGDFLLGPDL